MTINPYKSFVISADSLFFFNPANVYQSNTNKNFLDKRAIVINGAKLFKDCDSTNEIEVLLKNELITILYQCSEIKNYYFCKTQNGKFGIINIADLQINN